MHPDRENQFRSALEFDPPKFVDRVDTPWSDVPDLAEYNRTQYRRLERSLRQLAQSNSEAAAASKGVLVLGEAGTGKTHLLMRVASNLSDTNHILFVRKPNNEETVAHHIWSNIVNSLTRSIPSSGANRSQLDDLLAHVFSRVLISNFKDDVEKGVQVDQPRPLPVVAFNYRRNPESRFEYGGFKLPNSNSVEVEALAESYGATPRGIREVNVFAYEPEIARRASDYEGLNAFPIQFRSDELSAEHWEILMKPPTPQTEYMDIIRNVIQGLFYQKKLNFDNLEHELLNDDRLSESQRRRAVTRLSFASQWINDDRTYDWSDVLNEGALNVVDLRMQTSEPDDALKLCLIVTDLIRRTKNGVNKLVVFDEAHEYVDSKSLIKELENAITQIRHDGLSFVLASQFPDRIPERIFKYLLTRLLFKLPHSTGVKYLHKMAANLKFLSEHSLSNLDLEKGVCYIQTDDESSDPRLKQPRMLTVRPRCTLHGGATRRQTASSETGAGEETAPPTESMSANTAKPVPAASPLSDQDRSAESESNGDANKSLADLNEEFGIPWNRFLDLLQLPRNHPQITPSITLAEARRIAGR